jgi:hypothetical protein
MKNETLTSPKITRSRNSVNVNWFSVCKGNGDNVIQITSKSEFFNTPLVYKITGDLIILRKLTIRDNKRIVVPKKGRNSEFYRISIITKFEIENNRYDFEFDEDDEDVISAYYK